MYAKIFKYLHIFMDLRVCIISFVYFCHDKGNTQKYNAKNEFNMTIMMNDSSFG